MSDFKPGDRVQLHPGTSLWMRGARYGTVLKVHPRSTTVRVQLDRAAKPRRIKAFNLTLVDPPRNGKCLPGWLDLLKPPDPTQEHKFEANEGIYPETLYCKHCGASETDHRL